MTIIIIINVRLRLLGISDNISVGFSRLEFSDCLLFLRRARDDVEDGPFRRVRQVGRPADGTARNGRRLRSGLRVHVVLELTDGRVGSLDGVITRAGR